MGPGGLLEPPWVLHEYQTLSAVLFGPGRGVTIGHSATFHLLSYSQAGFVHIHVFLLLVDSCP